MVQKLDFSGRTQLYFQLYDILYKDIVSGKYMPGDLLPTENELIQLYGISRVTVRKAMDLLINDELIEKRRGYGTFVRPHRVEQTMKRVLHFSEEMQKRGFESTTMMLSNEIISANRSISEMLCIAEETPLVCVTRLRVANATPLSLEIAYLVVDRCPEVHDTDFSVRSLRHFIEDKYGIIWKSASQKIFAINASAKIANLLSIKENSAVIYIERVSSTADGKPGEYLQSYYRGDSYYLVAELMA